MEEVLNVNHAIIISGLCIYDSSYIISLPLKKKLDIIFSTLKYDDEMYEESEVVFYAVRYMNPKEKFRKAKYTKKYCYVQIETNQYFYIC